MTDKTKDNKNLEQIIDLLKAWINNEEVGSVTINFFKGGISSVKLLQTLKMN
jgi:hypothetical protein